ncbi:hypothetical protein AB0L40_20755 [Patulibacter sp. NPDC049589]|uniref:hypothetical protein n=1 Tax=Patulibacter sp. NPDC049589 TaxID=3154731 RepID=UPI003433540D
MRVPISSPPARRRLATVAVAVGVGSTLVPLGISAAADGPASAGDQATPRALKAGRCAKHYASGRNLFAKQRLLGRTPAHAVPDGVASEPVFSRDSRRNRFVAYVSTTTSTAGIVTPGRRNVYAVQRTGKMTRLANNWKVGPTRLLSDGLGGAPADGDSFSPSISGYTGRNDRPKGPRKVAFLSTATNLAAGGNPTGTSAFVTGTRGGSTRRVKVPGAAASVAISGDSKVVYVATDRGLYVEDEGRVHRLVLAPGIRNVTTTLNGAQAAYERSGYIYVVNLKGGVKGVVRGTNPVADGGVPDSRQRLGFVRAIAFQTGNGAFRAALDGKKRNIQRMGTSTGSSVAVNVGGSAVVFGNRDHACLEVSLLDATHRRGGYDIPQGACPAGQGTVADVTVSSRYNYLAFTCTGGGLYLHYVGPK